MGLKNVCFEFAKRIWEGDGGRRSKNDVTSTTTEPAITQPLGEKIRNKTCDFGGAEVNEVVTGPEN